MATLTTEHGPTRRLRRNPLSAPREHLGTTAPTRPRPPRRSSSRIGSKQVISVRGRRVAKEQTDPKKVLNITVAILAAVAAIAFAMYLSGMSTEKQLEISAAQVRERELRNSLEVLERDVAYLRSTGQLAQWAAQEGLVNPQQPAILMLNPEGELVEVRPGDAATQGFVDLNDAAPSRPHQPSSDPAETENVPGMQPPVVHEAPAAPREAPATAPYAPPQPAPGPVLPPAPEAAIPAVPERPAVAPAEAPAP